MKKITALLLACLLIVGCVLCFASCGGVSGKYTDGKGNTWKFSAGTLKIYTTLSSEEVVCVYDVDVEEDESGAKTVILTEKRVSYSGKNPDLKQRIKETNAAISVSPQEKEFTYTEVGDGSIKLGTTLLTPAQ